MNSDNTFDSIRARLNEFDVSFNVRLNPSVTHKQVAELEKRLTLSLPTDYVQHLVETSNGFCLQFVYKGNEVYEAEMLSVEESIEALLESRQSRIYTDEEADAYGFPYVDDPNRAKMVNAQMRDWLPLVTQSNGDQISLDLNRERLGAVTFDKHDWLDGGTGENGLFFCIET